MGLRGLVALSVRDGVVRHEELRRAARLIPPQQVADLENLESLGGGVVRPAPLGNPGESGVEEVDDPPGDGGEDLRAVVDPSGHVRASGLGEGKWSPQPGGLLAGARRFAAADLSRVVKPVACAHERKLTIITSELAAAVSGPQL